MMRTLRLLTGSVVLSFLAACAAGGTQDEVGGDGGGSSTTTTGDACVPGQQVFCACPGGSQSVQSCADDGASFGPCDCRDNGSGGGATGAGGGAGDGCGDGTCAADEDCHTCDADCGTCAPCTLAPSCDNAQIPPASLAYVPALDNVMRPMSKAEILARLESRIAAGGPGVRLLRSALAAPRAGDSELTKAVRKTLSLQPALRARVSSALGKAGIERLGTIEHVDQHDFEGEITAKGGEFPGGTMECGSPLLRIRAAKVTVHEEDDDFANDIVYCALSSEAATASEIRVTPKTPNLDQGDSFTYPIEAGVFWGQVQPETPGGNLLLTYDCFESDSSTGYQQLIDGIGNAADQIGGVAGDYGWIFTVVGAVAPVVSDALALDGDDHLFNAQQTIGLDAQLDLTNGRYWSVRRSGTHVNSDWDWELRIEAWGCAQYGTL
jgi:hypothetical protein